MDGYLPISETYILHYALGFPPYRSGGMTKYCVDLMKKQIEEGFRVGLMWPGEIKFLYKKTYFRRKKWHYAIDSYEVVNPLPVPLDEGVQDCALFVKSVDKGIYSELLKDVNPSIIFIHTLMGLHEELLEAAKDQKIKLIFLTHDYYGLCPKVTFFRNGAVCENLLDCDECPKCNASALSYGKIMLMQSKVYRQFKDSSIVAYARKRHRNRNIDDVLEGTINASVTNRDYILLREFYISMLEKMDVILFNSSVSKEVYFKYLTPKKWDIFAISHLDIRDNREKKMFGTCLLLSFLSPLKSNKGFKIIIDALDKLYSEGCTEFILNVYRDSPIHRDYLRINEPYSHNDLNKIMKQTDLMLAPSIWYETFGFTVLEAISFGVPVLVSKNVGAKDVIGSNCGWIIEPCSEALYEILNRIYHHRDMLLECNENILKMKRIPGVPMSSLVEKVKSIEEDIDC